MKPNIPILKLFQTVWMIIHVEQDFMRGHILQTLVNTEKNLHSDRLNR